MAMDRLARQFVDGYITAALWSSTDVVDGEDVFLDNGEYELADETRQTLERQALEFWGQYREYFNWDYLKNDRIGCSPDEYAGHDFWLTRCGHGCGFWDGDWKEPAATILTDAAHKCGNVDLYVGDDGLIYL